jgi:hypothetical protein
VDVGYWQQRDSSRRCINSVASGGEADMPRPRAIDPSATFAAQFCCHAQRRIPVCAKRNLPGGTAATAPKPSVAEYLMTLAASYIELAERALRLREPVTAVRRQHIKVMQKE